MGIYEDNYLAKRPQSLCKMCGKCCRVVTTSTPYNQLKEMAENGDQGAQDFLSLFVPYESVSDAKMADEEVVNNIIMRLSEDENFDSETTTFYYCKYLRDDNLCSNYESRLTLCKHCPSSAWSIVPPNCGFEGWLFAKREADKEKVRRAKEELIELELLKKRTNNQETLHKISLVEAKLNKTIDLFRKYGSENW